MQLFHNAESHIAVPVTNSAGYCAPVSANKVMSFATIAVVDAECVMVITPSGYRPVVPPKKNRCDSCVYDEGLHKNRNEVKCFFAGANTSGESARATTSSTACMLCLYVWESPMMPNISVNTPWISFRSNFFSAISHYARQLGGLISFGDDFC